MILSPKKHVLLLGAGTTHLPLLHRLGMEPISGARFTLVSESYRISYSGMIPGVVSRLYSPDQAEIDLLRLCRNVGVDFICAQVNEILATEREVRLLNHSPLRYDYLSVNLGGLGSKVELSQVRDSSLVLSLRPLFSLASRLEVWESGMLCKRHEKPRIVIVGGGASGCEMALALKTRFSFPCDFAVVTVQSDVLGGFGIRAVRMMHHSLEQRGIGILSCRRVHAVKGNQLIFENGTEMPFDYLVWATEGLPSSCAENSSFQKSPTGFLLTEPNLLAKSISNIFVVGDSAHFEAFPDLVKNGVYAVREAPVLFENIKASIENQPLRTFRPQRRFLSLLNTSDGEAILSYGKIALKCRWALRWKDHIDKNWMKQWHEEPTIEMKPSSVIKDPMLCGGCGAKVPAELLSRVLDRIEGRKSSGSFAKQPHDDAAILEPTCFGQEGAAVELQTVDVLRGMELDPFVFGQITAIHSLNDIWAMNGTPKYAQAIVCLPQVDANSQENLMEALLTGALSIFDEAGVSLVGGHSYLSNELSLGFSISGYGMEKRLFRKGALRECDKLILTKPLGTGVLLKSLQMGTLPARCFEPLIQSMLLMSPMLPLALFDAGVTAVTDVSGFGLLGHLKEMCEQSKLGAEIDVGKVPLLPGARDCFNSGVRSTMHVANSSLGNLKFDGQFDVEKNPALFDPQTGGGLLIGVPQPYVEKVGTILATAGYMHAAVIGTVVSNGAGSVIYLNDGAKIN